MRRLLIVLGAFLAGLPLAPDLLAQTPPPPVIVPQVTPRVNEPGPQVTVPKPPSPVQRPSSVGTGPQVVPAPHYRSARHRQVSPTATTSSRDRHTVNGGGYCSYNRCIQHCWDTGQQAIHVRSGSSCPDVCKRRGCSDLDRVSTGTWPQGW
jgi:hypothetical protein